MLKVTHSKKAGTKKITFALPADEAPGQVSVVGNFNEWTPGVHPLKKRSNGTVSTSVTVDADYIVVFRYLGENGMWFDDHAADYVDEGASVILAA